MNRKKKKQTAGKVESGGVFGVGLAKKWLILKEWILVLLKN